MLNFLLTPTWSALFNIWMISIILLVVFIYIIYDLQNKNQPWAVRLVTIIYAIAQIALKVILVIGVFDITANGMASGQWGLLIGYFLVLIVDASTIALIVLRRLENGIDIYKEMSDEEKEEVEKAANKHARKKKGGEDQQEVEDTD